MIGKGYLKAAVVLISALLLFGCGESAEETEPGETAAAEETTAPLEDTEPAAALFTLKETGEALPCLRDAWERGTASAEECVITPEGEDSLLFSEGLLYALQNKNFTVRTADSDFALLSSLKLGSDWEEESRDDYWGGKEKQPRSFFLSGDRAAVLSDCSRYGSSVGADGGWAYEDNTRGALDILDVSDPAAPVPMGSLGQSGTLCGAVLRGDTLFIVSRRQLFEEDCDSEDPAACLPAVYNGEERSALAPEKLTVRVPGSGWYTLVTAYDLNEGTLLDCCAVLGAGERLTVSEGGILFPAEDGWPVCCLFTETGIEEPQFAEEAELAALSPEPELSELFEDGTSPDAVYPWDGDQVMTLTLTGTGVRLSICRRSGRVLTELSGLELGYDLRLGCEREKAVYTDPEPGWIGLPAEDGWCLYRYDGEELSYVRSLFSYDSAERRRCFAEENTIYVADGRCCFALDRTSGEHIGSWDLRAD